MSTDGERRKRCVREEKDRKEENAVMRDCLEESKLQPPGCWSQRDACFLICEGESIAMGLRARPFLVRAAMALISIGLHWDAGFRVGMWGKPES